MNVAVVGQAVAFVDVDAVGRVFVAAVTSTTVGTGDVNAVSINTVVYIRAFVDVTARVVSF